MSNYKRDVIKRPYWIVFVPVLLLSFFFNSWFDDPRTPLEKGLQAFSQRAVDSDEIKPDTVKVNQAIDYFKKALDQHPKKAVAGYYYLRALYFKGVYTSIDHRDSKEIFELGRNESKTLYELHPEDPRILYWYAAHLAKWAETTNIVRAAKNGTASKIRDLAQQIMEIDSTYQGGGGHRLLAQVHYYTPDIPMILQWPSTEKGLNLIQRALKINDRHPANHLVYAQLLEDMNQHSKAHDVAQRVINLPYRDGYAVEDQHIKDLAKELLLHPQRKDKAKN